MLKEMNQKITPFLWFNTQAEEAAKFYTSIFKNSKILTTTHYGKSGEEVSGQPSGTVMTVEFTLNDQHFTALNGGPHFTFTEAISFVIDCKDQKEVDYYWEKLTSNGGQKGQCGWLKDKYGVSWQIVPRQLNEFLMKDKSGRVMQAMLKMKKIEIKELEEASEE